MVPSLVVDGKHLQRLMRLCRLIDGSRGLTAQKLRGRLRTSRRTVFRDLSTLTEMGIGIEYGDTGYSLSQRGSACKQIIAAHQKKALDRVLRSCLK